MKVSDELHSRLKMRREFEIFVLNNSLLYRKEKAMHVEYRKFQRLK